jgi:hypothetical protein
MKSILTVLVLLFNLSFPLRSQQNSTQNIVIYSGNCVRYKRTFVPPNQVRSTPLDKAFGKIVINRSNKHINFYYNGHEVFSRTDFDSEISQQGSEELMSYNGVELSRFIAERYMKISLNDPMDRHGENDMGLVFEIINYATN